MMRRAAPRAQHSVDTGSAGVDALAEELADVKLNTITRVRMDALAAEDANASVEVRVPDGLPDPCMGKIFFEDLKLCV